MVRVSPWRVLLQRIILFALMYFSVDYVYQIHSKGKTNNDDLAAEKTLLLPYPLGTTKNGIKMDDKFQRVSINKIISDAMEVMRNQNFLSITAQDIAKKSLSVYPEKYFGGVGDKNEVQRRILRSKKGKKNKNEKSKKIQKTEDPEVARLAELAREELTEIEAEKHEVKPPLLCVTFSSLTEEIFPIIMNKIYAFNTNTTLNGHQNKIDNNNNGNGNDVNIMKNNYCDWFVVFYGGNEDLMKKLKKKMHTIEKRNSLYLSEMKGKRSMENRENRYKGKVVKMVFASRNFTKNLSYGFQEKYLKKAMIIEELTTLKKRDEQASMLAIEKNRKEMNKKSKNINTLIHPKPFLFLPLLHKEDKDRFNIFSYSHIWLIDDDLDLSGFDLGSYVRVRSSARFFTPATSYISSLKSLIPDFSNQAPSNDSEVDISPPNFSPIVTQPLIAESTQSYKYLNHDFWKFKKTSLRNNHEKIKKPIIAAQTNFIEIQSPIIDTRFFVWFLEFFVIPLFDVSEIMGTDWGLDSLFCEAAKFYRKEEITYRNQLIGKKGKITSRKILNKNVDSSDTNVEIDENSDENSNESSNDNVVCAVITAGTPMSHKDTKGLDETLGKKNKKLLNEAMMDVIKRTFPYFYLDGHDRANYPLEYGTGLKVASG